MSGGRIKASVTEIGADGIHHDLHHAQTSNTQPADGHRSFPALKVQALPGCNRVWPIAQSYQALENLSKAGKRRIPADFRFATDAVHRHLCNARQGA